MSKKIIIHIGSEKTATTYIQNFLSVNRNTLLKTGVYYPKTSFGEHAQFSLVAALHEIDHGRPLEFSPPGNYTIESEWHPLIDEFNSRSDVHTMLLSAEHFSSRLRDGGLKKLGEILSLMKDASVEILYYFRRQDDYFESWYSTHIKAGGISSLEASYNSLLRNEWFFDNSFIVSKWAEYIRGAKIIVRPYDLVKHNPGVLKDFLNVVGIEYSDEFILPILEKNESWRPEMLALGRFLNKHKTEELGSDRYKILSYINSLAYRNKSTSYQLLSTEKRKEILSMYHDVNLNFYKKAGLSSEVLNQLTSIKENQEILSPDDIEIVDSEVVSIILSMARNMSLNS